MKFYLLTHQRELDRKSNTGQLVLDCLADHLTTKAERIIWDRVNPDPHLTRLIQNDQIALVYPKDASENTCVQHFENILIIDSTWQEANKIYNRSAYLKHIAKFKMTDHPKSNYQLRRNQPKGGLCTAECVIEILRLKGETHLAEDLTQRFSKFNLPR